MSTNSEITSMLDSFAAAWQSNESAAVASFFAEDGTLVNPFGELAAGRPAVEAMYKTYFGGLLGGTATTIDLTSVRFLGNHAFVDAEQSIHTRDGNIVLAAHLTALLRSENDRWFFVDARPYVPAVVNR